MRGLTSSEASSNQIAGHGELTSSHESVGVADWTPSHVAEWLQRISLQRYVELFTSQHVNGETLLQLDSTRMKVRHRQTDTYGDRYSALYSDGLRVGRGAAAPSPIDWMHFMTK